MWVRQLFVMLLMGVMLAGCHSSSRVVGNGNIEKEVRSLGDFTRLSVYGNTVVNYKPSSVQSVAVQADSNIIPLIQTQVQNGVLIIRSQPGAVFTTKNPIVINLASTSLVDVHSSGANTVNMADLNLDALTIDFNGSGQGVFSGKVNRVRYSLVGASQLDARALKAKQADVQLIGASELSLSVSDKLNVSVSGVGKLTYFGSPTISQSISGLGVIQSGK